MNLTNNVIIHNNIDGTEFIQFRKLLEFSNVKHCYTLKKNKINIQVKNDDKTELIESYKKIGKALKFNSNKILKPYQTHTDKVECVKNGTDKFDNVDGVITDCKNIMLCTTSADCTSLFFYDDNKKVIGNIHSGWRGTLKQIGKKAVEKMIEEYGCNPKDIICCIGPCIKKCHFEVDEDVMNMFSNEYKYMKNINKIIEKGMIVEGKQKYNIDTTLINKIILQEIGIKEENIIDSNICTVCNSDLFHSHRIAKDKSGRNGAFIGIFCKK